MIKVTVDNKDIMVDEGITVLQACELAGKEIPRFCYHDRLSIAGNCRMCLVEVEKSLKPVASCAMPVTEGMVIRTDTSLVKKARNGVMEFLLINHPLDCPICDQGGECDLQDQAIGYGYKLSRYSEHKRAVKEKYMGPLVKTIMTRCIHCTRCIRFATEIAGVEELGAINRGENMEITTYLEKSMTSELSANVIDLCPVGALTSKPYEFKSRPWELSKTETIDVMDSMGANIRVDTLGEKVMRILPRVNDELNEEWISDKTRYACDGLSMQRLDQPYRKIDGILQPCTWDEAFSEIKNKVENIGNDELSAVIGDLVDTDTLFAFSELVNSLQIKHVDCFQNGGNLKINSRSDYLFNTSITGIEESDFVLLIGTNLRKEAPLINSRIRKNWLSNKKLGIALIGKQIDLTYPYEYLGNSPNALVDLLRGRSKIYERLINAKKPMLILGEGAIARKNGLEIHDTAKQIAEKFNMIQDNWNGFNFLPAGIARTSALDFGLYPKREESRISKILNSIEKGKIKCIFLLSADELSTELLKEKKDLFVIYQGSHGDSGARCADVILPGCAYTEKDSIYVNLEGRVQFAKRAAHPPGKAMIDWKIINNLSQYVGSDLGFNDVQDLRNQMTEKYQYLSQMDTLEKFNWIKTRPNLIEDSDPFEEIFDNFYLTNPIARASRTMIECSKLNKK